MGLLDNRELRPHLLALAAVAAATLVLALWPRAVLGAGYTCELRALFGIRCPFCGMTRDFAAMLHGQAPSLNPCSRAAALAVWLLYPAAVLVAWRTHRLSWFSSRATRCAVAALLLVMLLLNNLRH
jgi:hypothetical protein